VPPSSRPFALRRTVLAVPLLAAAVACGGSERSSGAAAGEPLWLWREHDLRHVEAAAFYAVREIELPPARGAALARIVGDEEYVLFVNGARIGSGRCAPEGQGDEFDVTRRLRAGRNRIVAELRSSTGAGGFWFELVDDGGRLVRSDGDWTVYRGEWRGLFRGGAMLPGDRPLVLGPSPLGRWGSIATFHRRPEFESALAAPTPVPAVAWRPWGSDSAWNEIEQRQRRPASFGPLVVIDFGEVRTGYLQLLYRDSGGEREPPALIRFGLEPPPAPPADADLLLRPIPGRNLFQDAVPRRFRYAAVAGLPGLFGAELLAFATE
jgi:hypothetical protein